MWRVVNPDQVLGMGPEWQHYEDAAAFAAEANVRMYEDGWIVMPVVCWHEYLDGWAAQAEAASEAAFQRWEWTDYQRGAL